MMEFQKFFLTPAGLGDTSIAVAACRAGATGVVNAELGMAPTDWRSNLASVVRACDGHVGIKLAALDESDVAALVDFSTRGLRWVILDAAVATAAAAHVAQLRASGLKVIAEVVTSLWPVRSLDGDIDGLMLKGNEAGGFVGEDSSFILLQKWLGKTDLPIYLRGGMTPQVAAGVHAVGVAGGVFDSQLLLLDEARLPEATRTLLASLSGNETVAVGDGERGEYFRILNRPGHLAAKALIASGDGLGFDALRPLVEQGIRWADPKNGLLPIGHDICFAAVWRKRYGHIAALCAAVDAAIADSLRIAAAAPAIREASPFARSMGVRFPIVQGPMTRVSDVAEFAHAVALNGALPMVAFALLKGKALETLLVRTTEQLGTLPWGIGLLGFAPQSLLDEQLAIATRHKPSYAIIAGGRPDQAVKLEAAGIPSFLHVPSANLIPMFLQEGARRFIFEGRECGGHIGPLSSFVLWSTMVDRVLDELDARKAPAEELELLFAGGIHDAVSSAIVQVLVAPLVARGVKVGLLMGSAYLFTHEIVSSGAIVDRFQREVIDCAQTVNLESGPGHASRCAYTPFAREFFAKRTELREQNVPGDESRNVLDDLILGRLRMASKGQARTGENGQLETLDEARQHLVGMYMLGQVATLRSEVTSIETLHAQVSVDAAALLSERRAQVQAAAMEHAPAALLPADVAIVGLGSLLPKSNNVDEYWENILDKVDGITEIPLHRWDWRLYFDADRTAKDKIYSKWGGFIDDMAFDPMKYGMPPKAIESVDPMQLMALEVARRTLVDAGYDSRPFDRERASVIIGASGGTGDVGSQYGLRSELPRFNGELAPDVAARLPEWTEDSFAGILLNVIAGRVANRLNFGGVNFTTDAACASSLAAIYQGVSELIAGRSDLVLAGGVDTVQGPFGYLCFSKTQALSPRGRCSTFDASGDGIVISEGIAMVALKRLADAERDGDRIYAVIKGVGGSSDGNAKGMTAPLPAGQLRAMRRAYAQAGFGPATVGLFEAHGTGTVAGDTAELESTTRLIQEASALPRSAVIGSVKTMIGHTKATAGVAGLIKAVLALHRRVLPPHRGVDNPNRILRQPDSPLALLDEATPWLASGDKPRRAAVSAFGFGGTNFHIVLEEHAREYREWLRPATSRRWPAELMLWGEADRASLLAKLTALQAELPSLDGVALRDVAASLAGQWRSGAETLAIVARSVADFGTKLTAALAFFNGEAKALPPGVHHGSGARLGGKLAVLFPGQGSQYPGMARELALHFPLCAETLAEADAVLQPAFDERFGAGTRLSRFIYPRGTYDEETKLAARSALTATDVAQPALGAVEAGLFRTMKSFGLQADMFAGHSYGEFVAQYAADAIDFDALMTLSAARGRFIVDAAHADGAELGTMAAVQALRKDVEEAIADVDGVIIANHNAPMQSILSGTRAAVKAAVDKLVAAGLDVTEIPVAAAFHSTLVKPAQGALTDLIDATPWRNGAVPVYSNTTARVHAADVGRTKRQMAEHLVRPVEFVAEIEAMHKDGARIFVEVGPKSVLTRLTSKILDGQPHLAVAIDDGTGLNGMLNAFAQLICAGVPLDVAQLFQGRDCMAVAANKMQALKRAEAVPKHAWMLNGSGARRAVDPVKQIGITLEQVEARAVMAAPAASAALAAAPGVPLAAAAPVDVAPAAAAPVVPANASAWRPVQRSNVSQKPWRKDRHMDDRRPLPATADSAVMSEYFETMRQFLETQERVMSAFMGESAAQRPAVRQPQRSNPALLVPRVAEYAPPQVAVQPPAAAPMAAPPAPAAVVAVAVAPAVVATAPKAAVAAPAVTTVAVAVAVKPKASAEAGASIGRDKMVDMLLGIVEEKTGYPRDMVGLDQNLESDLGIDSIKRIEVVGAMLQSLPEGYKQALSESRSKLNTQPTLNGVLDLLSQAQIGGAVTVPFELAEAGTRAAVVSQPPRHVIRAEREAVSDTASRQLSLGHFVLTRDLGGVADALAQRLIARGCTVGFVDHGLLSREAALLQWCTEQRTNLQSLAGIVHLAPLSADWLAPDAALDAWRRELMINEKSLFVLLHEFSALLVPGAHVLSASGLGGSFGRDSGSVRGLNLQSGSVGMLKSLREERPELKVKAVDVDLVQAPEVIAQLLLGEIELDGGRQEVGFPSGERTVFRTVAAAVEIAAAGDRAAATTLRNLVVLATGGARGITAEVLREIALPGNTLVLTGRSALPDIEPAELSGMDDAAALRTYFIAQVRSGAVQLRPADIQRHVDAVIALREMRSNLADFRRRGATAEYRAVDVTDDAAMQSLVRDVESRHGPISGIVHGAGVIEDKLLADKNSASWSRVVETKVLGLLLLQKHVKPDALRFLSVFSSVAGRYGNSGQSDYATANELMNRLCGQLQRLWGDRVNVNALCWGPWGATQFGAGMVTADTEAKFAEKGVALVTAAIGRRLFKDELSRVTGAPVEIVCGGGPWEQHEAAVGVIREAEAAPPRASIGPLLGAATITARPTGDQVLALTLDDTHLYLQEHCIDGTPILPAAAALELMAESAKVLWPGWKVIEVRDFKLMKGVDLKEATRRLTVLINPPPYGSSEGFEVNASLQSELSGGKAMTHYRCVVRLEQQIPAGLPAEVSVHAEKQLSVATAYGEWLFHGPRFQVIDAIDGLSVAGSAAQVRATHPSQWRSGVAPESAGWVFDPALIDAAAQMAWLWARAFRDESALPARFGRVARYREVFPANMTMVFDRVQVADESLVRANVSFIDADGQLVMSIDDLESVSSAALNRLGGTARTAVEKAAA